MSHGKRFNTTAWFLFLSKNRVAAFDEPQRVLLGLDRSHEFLEHAVIHA